jgi:hypothetical protein
MTGPPCRLPTAADPTLRLAGPGSWTGSAGSRGPGDAAVAGVRRCIAIALAAVALQLPSLLWAGQDSGHWHTHTPARQRPPARTSTASAALARPQIASAIQWKGPVPICAGEECEDGAPCRVQHGQQAAVQQHVPGSAHPPASMLHLLIQPGGVPPRSPSSPRFKRWCESMQLRPMLRHAGSWCTSIVAYVCHAAA